MNEDLNQQKTVFLRELTSTLLKASPYGGLDADEFERTFTSFFEQAGSPDESVPLREPFLPVETLSKLFYTRLDKQDYGVSDNDLPEGSLEARVLSLLDSTIKEHSAIKEKREDYARAALASWPHANLLAVADSGLKVSGVKLWSLPEREQKEAFSLLVEFSRATARPRPRLGALRALRCTKGLTDVELEAFIAAVWSELSHGARLPGYWNAEPFSKASEERVEDVNEFIKALKGDSLVEWVANGKTNALRRSRALNPIWSESPPGAHKAMVLKRAPRKLPETRDAAFCRYVFMRAYAGAPQRELVELFATAPHWAKVLWCRPSPVSDLMQAALKRSSDK